MQNARTLEQLIKEAQLGNKAAVEEIVERFQPLVWATARRFASNTDLADDFAQEGNLALLTAIYNYRPGAAPFTWYAKRQVYYAVRYALRCSRRNWEREGVSLDAPLTAGLTLAAILVSDELGPEEQALAAWDQEAFRQAWARLTPRQQQVIAGRMQGLTFAAIATRLKIAPSTAKGAYARAVARLKKLLSTQVQSASFCQSISEGGQKEEM
ncbi:MAG TPA: sigma-70 family RNA polymerase sigma factor [Firmicutes bacterium]|nr:sigma-70 family RNA polymerase sigma factor [Bacillota bacterium]